MKKKIWIIIALVAIIAWFVISNVFMTGYTGTFSLNNDHTWTMKEYTVLEGDGGKFDARITDGNKLKVSYDGDYELKAEIILKNEFDETVFYELRLYKQPDFTNDTWEICAELNKVDR